MSGTVIEGSNLERHTAQWGAERRGLSSYSGEPLILNRSRTKGYILTWEEIERLALGQNWDDPISLEE